MKISPLRDKMIALSDPNIYLVPQVGRSDVIAHLRRSSGLAEKERARHGATPVAAPSMSRQRQSRSGPVNSRSGYLYIISYALHPVDSMHWADVIAKELLSRSKDNLISTGITPSGTLHVGTLREAITAESVRKAVVEQEGNVRMIYLVDSGTVAQALSIFT